MRSSTYTYRAKGRHNFTGLVVIILLVALAIFILCANDFHTFALETISRLSGNDQTLISQGPGNDQDHDADQVYGSARNPKMLLVNKTHPLPDGYKAENLINIYAQNPEYFRVLNDDIKINEDVFIAMERMFAAADRNGVYGFVVTSGYRSADEQQELYATMDSSTAAKPGESEHQTGLAFDVSSSSSFSFESSRGFIWMTKHCAEYGFILRYPKGSENITGYSYEPWHFRYVGLPHSKKIMDKGITLEEYIDTQL